MTTATELFALLNRPENTVEIDVIVVGQIDDMTQLGVVRRVAALTGVASIVLTSTASPSAVMDLCAAGAHAVAERESTASDLGGAVAAVLEGRRYLASDLLGAMFDSKAAAPVKPRFDLTDREREVLAQLAAGRTNSEISHRLLIGTETVKTHLTNIYDKLDVRRRTHAVSLALAHGLV